MSTTQPNSSLVAAAVSAAVALLWVGLAWRTPTNTFHFAPLVASAMGPYVARTQRGPQGRRATLGAAGAAWFVVSAATTALAVTDRLRGPSFWAETGAGLEAVLFTAAGTVIGFQLLIDRGATKTRVRRYD